MRRYFLAIGVVIFVLALGSCAGIVYSRSWVINNQDLTDTLTITGDNFKLDRTGPAGTSVFQGGFGEHGERWVFEIASWKPANGAVQRFDPPIRYIYRVKKFDNGVSFLVLTDVVGTSPIQFIQRGDFELR